MRSTGGADAPLGSRLEECVLAATPSLWTLMQLLVGIVGRVLAAGALLFEPRVEARGDETVGALLVLGGPGRQEVGVLVLGVVGVPPDPPPLHVVRPGSLLEFLPQLEALERAALAAPAAGRAAPHAPVPRPHPVLGVAPAAPP